MAVALLPPGTLPHLLLLLLHVVHAWSSSVTSGASPIETAVPDQKNGCGGRQLGRSTFPKGFLFGAGSSAYQYEGGAKEGGKGPSLWDNYTHNHSERIYDRSNGDVAVDSYHRYKEDVRLLKNMGLDAYRFSISWSRIIPRGSIKGGINMEGVNYYNNLINTIISEGLQPFATLIHFDTPQALEDRYGGFLSDKIAVDFRDYAEVCFREFGDRVKYWITLNEPWTYAALGYASGILAPGRCTQDGSFSSDGCLGGDSGREPYLVAHNQLLAHAAAARLYKAKFQPTQKGLVGIAVAPSSWFVPKTNSKTDMDAVQRVLEFNIGWFMDPLTEGDYPFIMRALVRDRLPRFTKEQSDMLKGSFDFLGINYYTSNYVRGIPFIEDHELNYLTDFFAQLLGEHHEKTIGPQASSSWIFVYPKGLKELLLYMKQKYHSPIMYVTENGAGETKNDSLSLKEVLQDITRVDYLKEHLFYLQESIREGVDVRGYFVWSFLDNFEWTNGYTKRYGLHCVDFKNGLKRYPKKSAMWYQSFLKR